MSSQAWTIVTVVAGGVFTGAISLFSTERVWLWRRMPLDQYVVDFRRSLKRADPAMPILLVTTAVGAIGLASESDGAKQALLLVAIACQLIILIGSVALAEPINSQFRRRPEGVAPPGVEALRRRWRRLHLVRTALALAAFGCIAGAVAQS
ncbi:MAG: anthrone oxygenase family protein [Solirubrobacterales bacterium]